MAGVAYLSFGAVLMGFGFREIPPKRPGFKKFGGAVQNVGPFRAVSVAKLVVQLVFLGLWLIVGGDSDQGGDAVCYGRVMQQTGLRDVVIKTVRKFARYWKAGPGDTAGGRWVFEMSSARGGGVSEAWWRRWNDVQSRLGIGYTDVRVVDGIRLGVRFLDRWPIENTAFGLQRQGTVVRRRITGGRSWWILIGRQTVTGLNIVMLRHSEALRWRTWWSKP